LFAILLRRYFRGRVLHLGSFHFRALAEQIQIGNVARFAEAEIKKLGLPVTFLNPTLGKVYTFTK
jgi:hypothetical protein